MRLLITLLLITFVGLTTAQTLVPYPQPGMVQGEEYSDNFYNPGPVNITIWYVGDTIIGSTTYAKYKQPGSILYSHYTRYDSGKVYWAHINTNGSLTGWEDLMYDFSLGVNDTFMTQQWGPLVVDSVYTTVMLNGQSRKTMDMAFPGNPGSVFITWIDGIGGTEQGFFRASDFEGGWEKIICHKDSSGMVFLNTSTGFTQYDCDTSTAVVYYTGIAESDALKIEVFPNPSSGYFQINAQALIQSIEVFDVTGRQVASLSPRTQSSVVDMSAEAPGTYFILVGDGERFQRVAIVRE